MREPDEFGNEFVADRSKTKPVQFGGNTRPDRDETGLRSWLAVESLIASGSRVLCVDFDDLDILRGLKAKSCTLVSVGKAVVTTPVLSDVCDATIAVDLDAMLLPHVLPVSTFDVALFGGGFTELREASRVVRDVTLYLNRSASIVFLLQGPSFDAYSEETLDKLCSASGYRVVDWCHVRVDSHVNATEEGQASAGVIAVAAADNGTQSILPQSGAIRRRLEEPIRSNETESQLLASLAAQNEFLHNRVADLDKLLEDQLASFKDARSASDERYAALQSQLDARMAESEAAARDLSTSAERDRSALAAASRDFDAAREELSRRRAELSAASEAHKATVAELARQAELNRRRADDISALSAELSIAKVNSNEETRSAKDALHALQDRFDAETTALASSLERGRELTLRAAALEEENRDLLDGAAERMIRHESVIRERDEMGVSLSRSRAEVVRLKADLVANAGKESLIALLERRVEEESAVSLRLREEFDRNENDAKAREIESIRLRQSLAATIALLERRLASVELELAQSARSFELAERAHDRLRSLFLEVIDVETQRVRESARKLDTRIRELTHGRLARLRNSIRGRMRRLFAST